tara:strand:+ start:32 stop:1393 length:1362 start_codon:yes stop_codon:yes gene_type:complete
MRYISLFSGIGALDLAVRSVLGAETEVYVEIDGFCQKVLRARMKDGYLDKAEIFDDIRKFKWEKTDMVVGGFPCQPFSVAGERKGESDDRNMWPDTLRVIRMARPEYVFLENVPGLLSGDGEGRQPYVYTVLRDLAEEGFDAEWEIVGADDAGAPHRRKRWFCFAYRKLADSNESNRREGRIFKNISDEGRKTGEDRGESIQPKDWKACPDNFGQSGSDCPKLADSESERHGRGNSKECGDAQRSFQQKERTGSKMGSQAERCCGNRKMADTELIRTQVECKNKRKQTGQSRSCCKELADSDSSGYIHRESEIDSDKRRIDAFSDTSHSCDEMADSDNTGDCTHGYRDDSYRQEKDERWEELPLSESRGYYEDQFPNYPPGPSDSSGWEYLLSIMPEIEPAFCRISDDGKMANRMDRLKALGNAVAWQAGAIALRLCIERSGVLNGSTTAQFK